MRDKEEIKNILKGLKLPLSIYVNYKKETLMPALLTSSDEKTLEIKKILNTLENIMREIKGAEEVERPEDSEDEYDN